MSGNIDLLSKEKAVAQKATKALRSNLRSAISQTTNKRTGLASKAGSRAVFKFGRLQRVTLKAPHYIFKQHYGFEGKKSNGVNMRLKATDVLNKALASSNVLDTLADGIADIRSEQVLATINFSKNGK